MNFKEAYEQLRCGKSIKLPSWGGYWKWEDNSIKMYCKDGKILDIRETDKVDYTISNINSDEWIVVDGVVSTPLMALFGFGEAIKQLKNGKKVRRLGWNGKGMYLWLKPETLVTTDMCHDPLLKERVIENGGSLLALGTICMYTHDSTGRKAILTGWLASQSDMLSEDWTFAE